ncbi:ABC transporter ATP-binding protein [Advenella mimigardefordensis]|uniref:Putative high-affinity branched-chain amino acid transport ATP-binding protein BraG n=1 Tax=Advenella mimigardefordensis (strain DSM 17166 / LMG 22922 / DPN7) TaxID=1247726 RepID=W0PC97_ADVMD|nr:ABC transporter ATP-binding protein [Advenella mimigardefordensis]AHG64494.1 putative high-affinity branched-chain amino acid transport ATP-binding protein BraG [Advenella mimigardefordensis DPN7]
MSRLLEAQHINAQYGKVLAVNDVSLVMDQGQVVTVIGANGAGKSTLLNTLMGALPVSGRSQGQIFYRGEDISRMPVEERVAAGLCLVPEKRELFTSMSVQDNLLLGGFRQYRQRVAGWRDTLDQVYQLFPRLLERRDQRAGTLSGGERQMLAVGRAMMSRPTLLMLDEPSLGLAPRVVQEVFRIILRLRETGVSILLVEQNARAALQASDYGYVLEMGEIAMEGSSQQLRSDPKVAQSYLGLGHGQGRPAQG